MLAHLLKILNTGFTDFHCLEATFKSNYTNILTRQKLAENTCAK